MKSPEYKTEATSSIKGHQEAMKANNYRLLLKSQCDFSEAIFIIMNCQSITHV